MMKPVRVLIIDDSATMRQLIRLRLRREAAITVVGEAGNADEARQALNRLAPDVLTLDVEMPGQSGLDFLRDLMRVRPMPVIMISSDTQRGSAAAIEALSIGAVDCIGKPRSADLNRAFDDLPALVLAAASANLNGRAGWANAAPAALPVRAFHWNRRVVLIGASTGGVDALERIISALPADSPPVLIAQHMPAGFLASFAQRLNARCPPRVALACHEEPLRQGRVYLAPGGAHHLVLGPGLQPQCRLLASEKVNGYRPSADALFQSALPMAERVMAIVLTGMGHDGAQGLLALRRAGGLCLAQDEASSVVWGMPRLAWERGGASRLVPLDRIAGEILSNTSGRLRERRCEDGS
ncbi:MAG: chemotaxis response regulator protein-glutamate methylesterase [Paracoccus sp. (in: a-proteobacteria)]